MTIKELEQRGLKVKVRHLRRFQISIPAVYVSDMYFTKGQVKYDNDGKVGSLKNEIKEALDACKNDIRLSLNNNGGITQISIFDGDNIVASGSCECSRHDNFSKKQAVKIALGRACMFLNPIAVPKKIDLIAKSIGG